MIPAVLATLSALRKHWRFVAWCVVYVVVIGLGVRSCRHRDQRLRAAGDAAAVARMAPALARARQVAEDAVWRQRTAEAERADSLQASAARATVTFHRQRAHTDSALSALTVTQVPQVAGDTVSYVAIERPNDPRAYPVPRFVAGLLVAQRTTIDTAAAIIARQHEALARMDAVARLDSAVIAMKDSVIADLTRQITVPPKPKTRTAWRVVKWAGGAVAVAATVVLVR